MIIIDRGSYSSILIIFLLIRLRAPAPASEEADPIHFRGYYKQMAAYPAMVHPSVLNAGAAQSMVNQAQARNSAQLAAANQMDAAKNRQIFVNMTPSDRMNSWINTIGHPRQKRQFEQDTQIWKGIRQQQPHYMIPSSAPMPTKSVPSNLT